MKPIGQIIQNETGLINSEHKLSRFWEEGFDKKNAIEQPKTQKEIEYWDGLKTNSDIIFTPDQQKFIFSKFYRQVLKVGTDLSESDYRSKTKSDPELKSLIQSLIDWYFKNTLSKKGGFLIYSTPGVGKTKVVKALYLMSLLFGTKSNQNKIEFFDLNRMIGKHNSGANQAQDFSFLVNENIIIDELSERLLNVQSYGYKYSLSEVFENRYSIWQGSGASTIITTNIFPFKTVGINSLQEMVGERAYDRIKQQYEVIILTGESKRV
ncbi:MAG: hypothetical protein ABI851_12020 [Saprospiraceae bacterium]